MSRDTYCSGTFIGQRISDESIDLNNTEENRLKFTLCFTPTKNYPSVFGGGLYDSYLSIIHGTYNGTKRECSMIEIIDGISTYSYQCKLIIDKSKSTAYLHGTWKSLINSNLSGKLAMICEEDIPTDFLSGIWIGQSDPDEELHDFFIPINPIRWCITIFRTHNDQWQLFGSGYFNDSADIPDQPLLFFTLEGNGTLDDMNIIKKYNTNTDYTVEYRGKFIELENKNFQFQGRWSNLTAGSYGSFFAKQFRLNPLISYRLDICICEICGNAINPGDNRWCCFQCTYNTCSSGCHLNSLAMNHKHELIVDILPCQKVAQGNTSVELIENAFQLFHLSPLLIYKNQETNEFTSMNYGEMFDKCIKLSKYWKKFVANANDDNRPFILFICNTSPAYICCLLSGLLLQSVIVPINGSLHIDAIKHTLSITNPSIIVIDEQYYDKVNPILSSNQKDSLMIIYKHEEQFLHQSKTMNNTTNIISLTNALEFGETSSIDIKSPFNLSSTTISAIFSTSGSTGYPKGAIFTEDLIVPTDNFTLISPFIRIDYQPFDPTILLSLMTTIRYGSSRGLTNLNDMWNDIKYIKPTSLGLTPQLWNLIYKNYLSKLNDNLTLMEKESVEKEIRNDLGGRVHVGTSGGGSISPTVLFFIRNKLKIDLVDMYGCRECGNISKNGVIYPGIDVKLIPVADMDDCDGIHQGEICIHSPKMIQGYLGIDQHSSFIQIDGKAYYKTGDVGHLEGKTIKLIDRSGIMIKNSQGEWISPVKIENIIEQLSEISTSFIIGDSNYSYVIAIICPSQSGSTLNDIDMLQLIRFHCNQSALNGHEIPQGVFIERNIIWNEQNGLIKEKKCRHALSQYYSDLKTKLFNQELIYENLKNNQLTDEFIEILENILNRKLNGQINGDNTFLEIGADSLCISLLCKIFNDRGISIKPSTIYNHQLSHLNHILTKKHFISNEIIHDINWNEQSRLPHHIRKLCSNFKLSEKKNILVTGATGFLGPLIICEIAKQMDDNVNIYCIIRATDDEHAKQRLQDDLEKCGKMNLLNWKQIHCIVGDISKDNLGLTNDLYNKLIEEIGFIYHNASQVHLEMPYKALKKWNVQGTLNVLEFALKSHGKFIYTSSVAALPASNDLKEDSNGWTCLTSNEINQKDGYGQTKVICEKILKQASDLGAHIIIIRPCSISPHINTGYTNLNDFINILLRTQIELNTIVENSNMKLHFVPVDYCAKVTVALSKHFESQGKCFNLYGNPFSIANIYKILFDKLSNINIKKIKQNQWKEFVLNNLSENSRSWPLRERIAAIQFVNEYHGDEQHVGVPIHMTKEFLEKQCLISWFEIKDEDFIKSIDYMIQQKYFN
ncbi:unnamed protein product [Adineta steineri]|uniref:long-chain-fatty-acid--CoA ligase n=2 Tax=Adineta steineri TaxID=433720 RepID=A0A818H2E5_9BILA|nr:unnamed protein product [Adineta steineri]CAF3500427.1 unnamed protein product [Adineta steineri]